MFSLYNKTIYYIVISILVLTFQVNFPNIIFFNEHEINVDLVLVFITFLSILSGTYKIIIFSFFYGIILDIVLSTNEIGLLSFITSITSFLLISLKDYDNLWNRNMKFLSIFSIYLFHFLFFYLILFNDTFLVVFLISLFQAIFTFIIFYIISKFIVKVR
ncbi:MAG: hypothetical protein CMG61_04595 [Candidatus Marinimicrobia bacterium]|nr:hypothetical protein [Candidatus Neomarinimicrobiota bacterium]|tara:strand:+ start:10434 stop:10913 length:480 start_codon:yes stop_codon:yes gene_type:complete